MAKYYFHIYDFIETIFFKFAKLGPDDLSKFM